MQYTKMSVDAEYIMRLEKGDKIHDSIIDFCNTEGIRTAWITGIGAVCNISIGRYNPTTKDYDFDQYDDVYELTGLIGNVSLLGQEPYLHIHTDICNCNRVTYSGHLEYATVAATLELRITSYRQCLSRFFEEGVGLRLLQCGQYA